MNAAQSVALRGPKRPESVLVVVYSQPGEVLMMRRADHPLFWQSVTGSLEWDDADLAATARREVREETGLSPESGWRNWHWSNEYIILPEWRHRYAPGTVRNREHVFSLELAASAPVVLNPLEHHEYRWVDFSAAHRLATSWTNQDAIERVGRACGFPV
ncbi:MAG: dihydroneopterin triphosphate diphosphatase [Acidiferrobacteraceae bacterium]